MLNPFTFLRENKIAAMLRAKVLELLAEKKEYLKELAEKHINEKSPATKELLLNFFVEHVKLKFPYSLFKGTIKKAIEKNFDRLVAFAIEKIKEV